LRTTPCVALTLWLRMQARARATGTRRAPAPSRLAQRDVAKTCQPNERVWARKVSFPSATFAPGAGLKTELRGLADVPRLREADRKQEETNSKTTTQALYPIRSKSERKMQTARKSKLLILRPLFIHKRRLIGVGSTEAADPNVKGNRK
jgi:hypothetical protein